MSASMFPIASSYRSQIERKRARARTLSTATFWVMVALTLWLSQSDPSPKTYAGLLLILIAYWFPASFIVLMILGLKIWIRLSRQPHGELTGYGVSRDELILHFDGGRRRRIPLADFTGWRLMRQGSCPLVALVPAPFKGDRHRGASPLAPEDIAGFTRELSEYLPRVESRARYAFVRVIVPLLPVCALIAVSAHPLFDGPADSRWILALGFMGLALALASVALCVFVLEPKLHALQHPRNAPRPNRHGQTG